MSERENDLRMLRTVIENVKEIGALDGDDEDSYQATMFTAFSEMLGRLDAGQHQLTEKQRAWVRSEADKVAPEYENLVSSGKVPRRSYGPEVKTLPILDPSKLPKRPPGRS